MKKEMKFFICKHCGNIVTFLNESGAPLSCCGDQMTQIIANTQEAATEKHIPVVTVDAGVMTVQVGSVEHPMLDEHYIQWIAVESEDRIQIKHFAPGDKPQAEFCIQEGKEYTVYEYCNLHGLWKA